jgi:Tfp pilus assembly protein PilP
MRARRWLVWMWSVSLLAVGCGGGPSSPGQPPKVALGAQPQAAKATAQKPALPTVMPKIPEPGLPLPPLTYEAKGRRDPFTPVLLAKEKPGLDLTGLRLVGIIRGRQPLALVEGPGGLGYVLKPGDGLANGHVTDISADSVTFSVNGRPSQPGTSVTLKLAQE